MGGEEELLADTGLGAAAFVDVAVDTALEAYLGWGGDEDAEIVECAERLVVEGEDAFDEDNVARGHGMGAAGDAGVGGEVVDGGVDGLAGGEGFDVLCEERVLERVGVVEVLACAVFRGEVREIAVVEVERYEGCGELLGELAGERGFAGAGAACDGEDEGFGGEGELLGFGHA